jgi:hypothetical protein
VLTRTQAQHQQERITDAMDGSAHDGGLAWLWCYTAHADDASICLPHFAITGMIITSSFSAPPQSSHAACYQRPRRRSTSPCNEPPERRSQAKMRPDTSRTTVLCGPSAGRWKNHHFACPGYFSTKQLSSALVVGICQCNIVCDNIRSHSFTFLTCTAHAEILLS